MPSGIVWDGPAAELSAGDHVGQYTIRQKLGEGGFAVVYMADQARPIRRRVAVKIIKLGMDTREVLARFEGERQALALMDHPNIARILDAGSTESGRPYFVLDYVPGVPITTHCDRLRLGIDDRLDLFIQVCEAVQHSHERGVIHRDLKPSNVLVTVQGDRPLVKVIDFGVAKAISQRLTEWTFFTEHGQLIGTPEYMSPEQAEMTPQDIDTRADIYSLGVLLYELVAGALPFDPERLRRAALAEVHRIIREVDPPKPSTRLSSLGDGSTSLAEKRGVGSRVLVRELRGDLDWITMKAMEKDRALRYETPSGLASDIKRHLERKPVTAGPPSPALRLRKFARRHRTAVTGGVVAALVLILAAVGTALHLELRGVAETRRERAERQTYLASIAEAGAAIDAGDVATARTQLQLAPETHRGWEWRHLHSRLDASVDRLSGHQEAIACLAASSPAKLIASGSMDGTVRLWDARTLKLDDVLLRLGEPVAAVAFSRSGTRLASGSYDGRVRVSRVDDRGRATILTGHLGRVTAVAFSPDETRIVSGDGEGVARIWDVARRTSIHVLEGHEATIHSVGWTPDGTRIVTASADSRIFVWDAATGERRAELTGHVGTVFSVAIGPGGDLLASGAADHSIRLWNLDDGRALGELGRHDATVVSVDFGPDGRRLVSGGADQTVRLWDVAERSETAVLRGHAGTVHAVVSGPLGTRLFSGAEDRTVRVWDLALSEYEDVLLGDAGAVMTVAFDTEGERIVSISHDKTVRLWDADSGRARGTLYRAEQIPSQMIVSSDLNRIAWGGFDGSVTVRDAAARETLFSRRRHVGEVRALSFDRGGRLVASGSVDTTVVIWEAATGNEVHVLRKHTRPVNCIAFAPEGTRLATACDDGLVILWDVADGGQRLELPGAGGAVRTVTFSPDGTTIAAGGSDAVIRIYEVETGELIAELQGHTSPVNSLAFHDVERRLVSGADDDTVRIWDPARAEALLTLRGHADRVLSVAFSPDGTRIVSGSMDQTLRIWHTAPPGERTRSP